MEPLPRRRHQLSQNDNLWLVAGFDTDVAGWNLNLQYSLRRVFGHTDPGRLAKPVDRFIASLSAAVNKQLDATQRGMSARVRKWRQDTLETEVSGIVYFSTGDAAIRLRLSYAIDDRLRATVAADIFVGPRPSYVGRVRALSAGFVQINYGF